MLDQGTATRNALQLADDVGADRRVARHDVVDGFVDGCRSRVAEEERRRPRSSCWPMSRLHPSLSRRGDRAAARQRLAQLVQQREDPNAIAGTVMAAALYGSKHPYGFTELGTEAAIKAMTRDDMAAFWKQNFVPNNAALVVAGAIDAGRACARWSEKAFGALAARARRPSPRSARPKRRTRSSCSSICRARRRRSCAWRRSARARSTPDYRPLEVMNMMLGGLFSSRINLNLREEHGYTYGAYSQFPFRKAPGPSMSRPACARMSTGPAVEEIFKELARMQRDTHDRRRTRARRATRSCDRCRATSRRRRERSARWRAPSSTISGSTTTRSIRSRSAP